jgi:hypothetical protein
MTDDIKKKSQAYWEELLIEEGFGMNKGSLGEPTQRDAVLEYLEVHAVPVVPPAELPGGFSTSEEMTEQYLKEK